MRTKTLILAAALSAAGAATSMAQVYSVNAVGYVNKTLQPGFNFISNPLIAANNTVPALFAGLTIPDNTTVYTFQGGFGVTTWVEAFGEWSDPAVAINLGDGAFVENTGAAFTLTFVGEVAQGTLMNPVPAGFRMIGSKVPQSGRLQADLGFPPADNDTIYLYANDGPGGNPEGFSTSTYVEAFGEWDNGDKVLGVAEGGWLQSVGGHAWTRVFTVN